MTNALSQNTLRWVAGPGALGGRCTITRSALHVTQDVDGNVTTCISGTLHATNYAIEVSEDLNAGYGGGIAYRVGSASYRFEVAQNGTVDFVSDSGPPDYETPTLFTQSVNNRAPIGPHQTVSIFSVVQGNHFDFWVDNEYLGGTDVPSPPAATGNKIGLFAFCQGDPADIAFQGLSVWNI